MKKLQKQQDADHEARELLRAEFAKRWCHKEGIARFTSVSDSHVRFVADVSRDWDRWLTVDAEIPIPESKCRT